jgi:hypothetical protein
MIKILLLILLSGCSIHIKTIDVVTVVIVDSKIQPEILTNKTGVLDKVKVKEITK